MQKIIQNLENLLNEYTGRLQSIPEDEFSFKPSPSKWSKKEILGHLIDSAQNRMLGLQRKVTSIITATI